MAHWPPSGNSGRHGHDQEDPTRQGPLIRPNGSVIRYVREEDDDQKPADHYRTVDTLALMLRNGSITGAKHDAGQQFSQDFARAFASGVASSRLDGLPGWHSTRADAD